MKAVLSTLTMAFVALGAAHSSAQSLSEIAQKEKQRRDSLKQDSRQITNSDASRYLGGSITTGTSAPSKTDVAAPPPAKKPEKNDEPTDLLGRPESFWREAFSEARKNVKDLETKAAAFVLHIADLQNRFYAESNGFTQQSIQREIQKAFYEQDLNKEQLAKAKAQLDDLEKESRRTGALPGWRD
jgi:hypothetical protein